MSFYWPSNQQELDENIQILHDTSWSGINHATNFKNRLERKIFNLNSYFKSHGIESAIVGISGGVDSSAVLGLLDRTDLKEIHAVVIDFDLYGGIFDDSYVKMLQDRFADKKFVYHHLDYTKTLEKLNEATYNVSKMSRTLDGQTSYALRYVGFFSLAEHFGAVTLGTINSDEKFAGWFGKHSDLNVDLLPITDFHKFEVNWAAQLLNVPHPIITRTPTGDMVSRLSDEDVFGVTYDELSYLNRYQKLMGLVPFTSFITEKYAKVLALREKNKHKIKTFGPILI